MRKYAGIWKKAVVVALFGAFLSASTLPVSAEEAEVPVVSGDTTEATDISAVPGDETEKSEDPEESEKTDTPAVLQEGTADAKLSEEVAEAGEASTDVTELTEASETKEEDPGKKDRTPNDGKLTAVNESIQNVTGDPVQDGWVDEEGGRRYYKNGEYLSNTVLELDGDLYGFNNSGYLIKGNAFKIYNPLIDGYAHHRAKSDGKLYRSEWYIDGYNDEYFYRKTGAAPSDEIFKVDGVSYYFGSYGYVLRNSVIDAGTKYIFTDAKGVATSRAKNDGWLNVPLNGTTVKFYIKDGELVKEKVLKIGNKYYGFDSKGRLYKDKPFYIEQYDESTGTYKRTYHCAKSDGTLYTSEWYTSWYSKYFFDSKGTGLNGLVTLQKKQYLFEDGHLVTSMCYQAKEGAPWYVIDYDGIAHKLGTADGWYKVNNQYYYIKDKKIVTNQVLKINNVYYGFSDTGNMYDNDDFSIYTRDPDTGNYHHDYYRAKEGGQLYVKQWYSEYSYNSHTKIFYYYGAEGKAANGLTKIGNNQYYFSSDGEMSTSVAITIDGIPYAFGENGIAVRIKNDTFTTVDGKKYFAHDNEMYRSRVYKIGKEYYGFDSYGVMRDNEMFYGSGYYDENDNYVSGGYYRASIGGKLLKHTWYGFYHYEANARASYGMVKLGGKQYNFGVTGEAYTDMYFYNDEDEHLYYAGKDGVVTKVNNTGLIVRDATRETILYSVKGEMIQSQLKTIDGNEYYINDYGRVLTGFVRIQDDRYFFRADGTMLKGGWFQYEGDWYFSTKSGKLATGAMTLGGKQYYFDSYGEMQTGLVNRDGEYFLYAANGIYVGKLKKDGWSSLGGTQYYTQNGVPVDGYLKLGSDTYYFEDGKMVVNEIRSDSSGYALYNGAGRRVEKGWYRLNGYWYYVDPSSHHLVIREIRTIGGKKYSFDYNGRLQIGSFADSNQIITTDKDGAITSMKDIKEGWELVYNRYVYVKKNGMPYNGWKGNFYLFEGIMLFNQITPDGYYVGKNGAYQKTAGWIVLQDDSGIKEKQLIYAKKGGKLACDEWLSIGGKWYYFDGYHAVTGLYKIKYDWYIFDNNGVYLKTLGKKPKGWYKGGTDWYYFKNYEPVKGCCKIDGKTYGFNDSYQMITAGFNMSSYDGYTGLYFAKSGVGVTNYKGWKTIGNKWYYFGTNGRALLGWLTLGSKRYYIDEFDGMVTGYRLIDSRLYQFDANGALKKDCSKENGWVQIGKDWYYFNEGWAVSSSVQTVGGKTYLFGYDGKLVMNGHSSGYYADKNGVIVTNTWKKVEDRWYYFGHNGQQLYSGVYNIDGKVYYFRPYVSSYYDFSGYYYN